MNSRPLVIITTRLPPQICGIGTYSWLLHQHWPVDSAEVQFLVVDGAGSSVETLNYPAISEFDGDFAKLSCILDELGPANILLHYAGRAYNRYGCPLRLPPVLGKWKAKFPRGHLLILFHELPGDLPFISRHYWIDVCNRRVIRNLANLADATITNTDDHVAKLQKISGRADVNLVPVSSNIPAPENLSQERVRSEFVVFGLPFNRWQTLQMFDREIRVWQANGFLTKLHLVGPRDDKFDTRSRQLISNWPDPLIAVDHGILPPSEVSKVLGHARFALTGASVKNWCKSTAFMAYASHGCAVMGRLKSDSLPLSFTVAPEEIATISDVDLNERAKQLKKWYLQNADWNVVARRISDLLPETMPQEALK